MQCIFLFLYMKLNTVVEYSFSFSSLFLLIVIFFAMDWNRFLRWSPVELELDRSQKG